MAGELLLCIFLHNSASQEHAKDRMAFTLISLQSGIVFIWKASVHYHFTTCILIGLAN